MHLKMAFLTVLLAAASAIAQTSPPAISSQDALAILRQVTQKYGDASTLHIEAIQETTHSEELIRGWSKMILSATVGTGNRFRYEGRGPSGTALLISDGKTIWTYHYREKLFTEKPVGTEKPVRRFLLYGTAEAAAGIAKGLPHTLAQLSERLNSAELLPQENITIDGKQVPCIGIHYRTADLKKRDVPEPESEQRESTDEGTYWIDKDRMVIVKIERHMTSARTPKGSTERVASQDEVTSVFTTVELNPVLPNTSFTFTPPAEAKLIDEFPAQKRYEAQQRALAAVEEQDNAELIGNAAPDVQLESENGKAVSLSSYRGKPVFIDVWATWCGPCIAMLPELKKLNSDLTAHGVAMLSVDVLDDAAAAAKLLNEENVPWPNLHDPGDAMRSAFHASSAVPWQVFIDSDGKLVFYHRGEDTASLRAAIAALGPTYSSLATTGPEKPH